MTYHMRETDESKLKVQENETRLICHFYDKHNSKEVDAENMIIITKIYLFFIVKYTDKNDFVVK